MGDRMMNNENYLEIQNVYQMLGNELWGFIERYRDDDKILYKLKEYADGIKNNKCTWDIDKVQIVSEILQSQNTSEIREILAYLEQTNYGWQGETYKFYNKCSHLCRKNFCIDNSTEISSQVFSDMDEIFLHREYGAITTYLFGYCIASLFQSKLKEKKQSIPYFLQIACSQNSNVYKLVHEIAHICDVNAGLFENCKGYYHHYRECNHDHLTIYPSETGEQLLETLVYYKDIPVIVEGYENGKFYEALIREVANIPRRTKRLDIKAKFSMLPVFLSPELQIQFSNFLSLDLTEMDVTDEYIELIQEYKQLLAACVYELVEQAGEYFDVRSATSYYQKRDELRIIQMRQEYKITPMFYDFQEYVNRMSRNHNRWENLTSKDITNIGCVSYFFSYYMKVFKHSIRLNRETIFEYRGRNDEHDPEKLVEKLVEQVTDSLFQLHSICSPARSEDKCVGIDISDEHKAKKIRKKAGAYARDIVKYYQSYKVQIRITKIEYKDGRYVFVAKILPGTDAKLLGRYVEEVKRLLEVEVLALDKTSDEIKFVVSETPLNNNSLIKILESTKFKESEMDIPYAIGYDIMGEMVIADVAEFPHLLIGGASGFGKSSAIHSLLISIIYKQSADKVKLLLFDFGASGLKMFDKVPHMLQPTIRTSETEKGRQCLLWLQKEMEERLKKKDSFDEKSLWKNLKSGHQ